MDRMFELIPFMMLIPMISFVLVFGVIVAILVMNFKRMRKDDRSPRISVEATVVAKRMDVHSHRHSAGRHHASSFSSHTTYYATFQVESGDRMELYIGSYDYGMLVEGDRGILEFQGSRFLRFDRI